MDVLSIRKRIRRIAAGVDYYDPTHTYTRRSDGKQLVSSSGIAKHLFEEFDQEYWLAYKAIQEVYGVKPNWRAKPTIEVSVEGMPRRTEPCEWAGVAPVAKVVERLGREWLEKGESGRERGTLAHLYSEHLWMGRSRLAAQVARDVRDPLLLSAATSFWWDYRTEYQCIACECRTYSEKFPIAGTFDMLVRETATGRILIVDYKGLPLDTPIYTTDGWKTMGTVQVGDMIFDKKAVPRRVKAASRVHYKPCLEIVFDDNTTVVCDEDHRWEVYKVVDGKRRYSVMTAKEIGTHLTSYPKGDRKPADILKIGNAVPIDRDDVDLPIDPYVFGVWLGDGGSHNSRITSMNPAVWEEIERRGYDLGADVSNGRSGKAQERTVRGIRSALIKLGVDGDKGLPNIFLEGSRQQRLDLLRGLMDADGHYHRGRKRYVMNTTSPWQAVVVRMIVASLGGKVTIVKAKARGFGLTVDCYHANFWLDENPFLCRNQGEHSAPKFDRHSYRCIDAVRATETVPTRCIEVEGPSRTFVVGRNFLVTHNTDREISSPGFRNLKAPLSHLPEGTLTKYSLQLHTYAELLREHGIDVDGFVIVHLRSHRTGEHGDYELHTELNASREDALLLMEAVTVD